MINTIIFDFDGTLADTNDLILESWQHTFRHYTGAEGNKKEILSTFGETLPISIKKFFPDEDQEEAITLYKAYQEEIFEERVKIFDGLYDCIETLYNKGYNIAVVTSRMRKLTEVGLKKFGIDKFIKVVVTCEDTEKHKPNPEPILLALDKLGVESEEAVMIGDSFYDIKCAHNAKVKAGLVGWAVALWDDNIAKGEKPDYYFEHAQDIIDILVDLKK